MNPSKHNDSQGNAYGNTREDEQANGGGNSDLRNIMSLLGPPPSFLRRQEGRPLHELTPEERHRRTMVFLEEALSIAQSGVPSKRNSDFDSFGPRGGPKHQ